MEVEENIGDAAIAEEKIPCTSETENTVDVRVERESVDEAVAGAADESVRDDTKDEEGMPGPMEMTDFPEVSENMTHSAIAEGEIPYTSETETTVYVRVELKNVAIESMAHAAVESERDYTKDEVGGTHAAIAEEKIPCTSETENTVDVGVEGESVDEAEATESMADATEESERDDTKDEVVVAPGEMDMTHFSEVTENIADAAIAEEKIPYTGEIENTVDVTTTNLNEGVNHVAIQGDENMDEAEEIESMADAVEESERDDRKEEVGTPGEMTDFLEVAEYIADTAIAEEKITCTGEIEDTINVTTNLNEKINDAETQGDENMDEAEEIESMADVSEENERDDTEDEAGTPGETEMTDFPEKTEAGMLQTETGEMEEDMDKTEDKDLAEVESKNLALKKKKGKNVKVASRVSTKKQTEEDVCFICFDGGDLVICDRRGCPKAYHPSCVNRDEAFFQSKGRWNCGWHLCSNCEKNARYMCYTCTFSLCKACSKDAVIFCVKGNKGFCETCMRTVMLIENEQGNKEGQVDFNDKSSWEYLFKDYWIDLKERFSITADDVAQARNPSKGSDQRASKHELSNDVQDGGSKSEGSSGNAETPTPKKKNLRKRLRSHSKEIVSSSKAKGTRPKASSANNAAAWASGELLEFVMHMRSGDRSVLTQFEVQELLLKYIKRNKLRDPRRKSQIICDSRLQNLFGKPRVGHFEMLKLLESHFFIKEDPQVDDFQGTVVDNEASKLEAEESPDVLTKAGKDKKRKTSRKRGAGSNLDDYAAIDMHNIGLVYMRRALVEDLIEDTETFQDKVVGAFVRIRISGSAQKQDLYRLVQVVGTNKASEPYKVGKRVTHYMLEILNLNKTEIVSIDIISNQEFTEDECKRLRQSIKCGLINRLTVGDIQEKARALQEVRVKDWLETESLKLSHLRDRASDMGHRKELRECVEKLQRLKEPEERQRRLDEIPEIHADPHMDPSYESEEDGEKDDNKQETYMRPRGSGYNSRRVREPISPRKVGISSSSSELSRSLSNKGRDTETSRLNSWDQQKSLAISEASAKNILPAVPSDKITIASEIPAAPSTGVSQSSVTVNETEKMWMYQDPSGKIQGPFSVVQLRKWSNTGYFPAGLKIWRANETQEDSMLLTDALAGKFPEPPSIVTSSTSSYLTSSGKAHAQQEIGGQEVERLTVDQNRAIHNATSFLGNSVQSARTSMPSVEIPKNSTDNWGSTTNLPSPTPGRTFTSETNGKSYNNNWSPTPATNSSSPRTVRPQGDTQTLSVDPNLLSALGTLTASLSSARGNTIVDPVHQNPNPPANVTPMSAYTNWNGTPVQNPLQPSSQRGQLNSVHPNNQQSAPWVMSNQNAAPQHSQNSGWGPVPGNPNTGWGGPVPVNGNPNPNPVWTPPAQGNQNQGWSAAPAPRNSIPGWIQPGPVPVPVNNPNQGWGHSANNAWQLSPGNPTDQNQNTDRFSNQRGSQGEFGYGGNTNNSRPWNNNNNNNRQSSFGSGAAGSGSSRFSSSKGQRVCQYHASGHCKKGSSCNYPHN